VNSRVRAVAVVLAGLASAGAVLQPLRDFVGKAATMHREAVETYQPRLVTAHWLNAAIPGGLRALAADGLWLKVYVAWAARDLPRTETLIRLVTIVDDRPTHFWINGARIIAYDIADWRLSSPESARMPAEVRRRIVEEQACAGLRFLTAAGDCHPDCAAIWVEMGNIQLYRRRDLVLAAECYRHAAELPDAPYYAARIYAELLRRLGRDQDAYAWLCRLHPTLPVTDQAAMSELVLRRIRALERRLKVPVQEQYMPLCGIVTARKSAKSD